MRLHPIVVWIPMLDSDERVTADHVSPIFASAEVPQFWDGERRLGMEVNHSLGIESQFPAWDIYLFYPPDAEWTDRLPPPEKAIAQTMGGVIGLVGTLPAKGDQSLLPAAYANKAVIVGEQSELAALLTQIAVPYVERYRAR